MKSDIRSITAAAVVGAAYAVFTIAFAPISFGAVQFRLSEALCVLPYFLPGTAWGLFIGCALANIMTGNVLDIVFGSLATLIAGLLTAHFGRHPERRFHALLACLMPVLVNALVVGWIITAAYNGMNILEHPGIFALNAGQIAFGEAAVLLLLGLPLIHYLPKNTFFREYIDKTNIERNTP